MNVLTEQIEAQNEKIQELEEALGRKTKQLAVSEDKLLQVLYTERQKKPITSSERHFNPKH